jgi:hypothetical protein
MSPKVFCQPQLKNTQLEIGLVFASGKGGAEEIDEAVCP